MVIALVLLVALLAFANGSNDNGKGVATLVGFGVARPFQALVYATAATALGGAVSFWLAGGLLKGFSGAWLFAGGVTLDQKFYAAVLVGACGWILLATRTGLPVSTTHAIVGALCGAGLVASGAATFEWAALGARFAVPLAVSPVLSLAVVYGVAWPVLFVVGRLAGRCACVVARPVPAAAAPVMAGAGAAAVMLGGSGAPQLGIGVGVVVGAEAECPPDQRVAAATSAGVANGIHWLSGGLISFARGWNDTPKIAALSLLALSGVAHGTAIGFVVVTVAMAAGGLLAGRKVLETMSKKLTPLPLAESLTASLVTAALVGLASFKSLPVSTTHVATGAIIGAGLKNDPAGVRWGKVGEVVLSWVVTLPVAALIAAAAKFVLR
jgi:PiT family inorganic phosphate transporter